MARAATGKEQVEMARVAIRAAKTADELRAAQAVLLPLECGLTQIFHSDECKCASGVLSGKGFRMTCHSPA